MWRILTDEDFDGRLTRALLHRLPSLDLVRVQDVGLRQTPDEQILEWAATHGRILLTHDRNTMTGFAGNRIAANEKMPGVFVFDRDAASARFLNDLELIFVASEMSDWQNQIVFVPL